jgi:hypothetical protein
MADRSYLRRIAQPLAPGDARLAPVWTPLPGDERPPVVDAPPRPLRAAAGRENFTPAIAVPGAERQLAGTMPDFPQDEANLPEPIGSIAEPQTDDVADRSGPEGKRTEPVRQGRAPLSGVGSARRNDPDEFVRWERPAPRRAEASSERPTLRIGTIEVRMHPEPAQAAPSASQPALSAPPARPPSAPLARGLAWRYGLVQG